MYAFHQKIGLIPDILLPLISSKPVIVSLAKFIPVNSNHYYVINL